MREALNSLYSLFSTTRQVLREAGPGAGASCQSVGGIAIAVLNYGLRPFLTKWHPLLQEWEALRIVGVGAREHEGNWSEISDLRGELSQYPLNKNGQEVTPASTIRQMGSQQISHG
jgi:hypothetical protein